MTMIKALLLDLGDTLYDTAAKKPFPGVEDALAKLMALKAADQKPMVMCLVSDYTMPEPSTPEAIAATFAEYLRVLDKTHLRGFFEPVDERVTLSTHAGVRKPGAEVFKTALKRAGIHCTLRDTLFITENTEHIRVCRDELHMKTLQFGLDFTSWSDAPKLISQKIGTASH
jgi:FMN phosphatase YigB (HAD superfamily)